MERQAGLGRSLRDVIESLTPVEPETAARVQFDASELMQRLDELLVDVRDLRERVHQLASVVGEGTTPSKPKKHKNKKKRGARND